MSAFANSLATAIESLIGIPPATVLRLVAIVGGYLLLRPLIESLFRHMSNSTQSPDSLPRNLSPGDSDPTTPKPTTLADERISGDLGLRPDAEEVGYDAEPVGMTRNSGFEWGDTARRRQAKFLEYWEREQMRRLEEEDLEDIQDLLDDT